MIYTVTLNPALDCIYKMDNAQLGATNRAESEYLFPGGKGVNVSLLLKEFGEDTKALGFLAGATGKAYEALIGTMGVAYEFCYLEHGSTRINLKISAKEETEFNGKGPSLKRKDLEQLCGLLEEAGEGDWLILSGKAPEAEGCKDNVYREILKMTDREKLRIVVDTAGRELWNALPYRPWLVKPNVKELEDLLERRLDTLDQIIDGAGCVQQQGARNVLVSMGGEGALLLTEEGEVYFSSAPEGRVRNTVGAGDSMVAGFLHGYIRTGSFRQAFRYGVAAGSATAFSFGIADAQKAEQLLELVDEKLKLKKLIFPVDCC